VGEGALLNVKAGRERLFIITKFFELLMRPESAPEPTLFWQGALNLYLTSSIVKGYRFQRVVQAMARMITEFSSRVRLQDKKYKIKDKWRLVKILSHNWQPQKLNTKWTHFSEIVLLRTNWKESKTHVFTGFLGITTMQKGRWEGSNPSDSAKDLDRLLWAVYFLFGIYRAGIWEEQALWADVLLLYSLGSVI
jgi:hypothetical protein